MNELHPFTGIHKSPGDNRPPVYVEDGVPIYRASGIGGCRALLLRARRDGAVPGLPPWMQEVANEGWLHEEQVLQRLADDYGLPVLSRQFAGRLEVEVEQGPAVIAATTDAILDWNGTAAIGEVKSMGYSVFAEFVRGQTIPDSHRLQIAVSQHAWDTGPVPAIYAAKNRNTGKLKVYGFEEPLATIEELTAVVAEVEAAFATGEVLPCTSTWDSCGCGVNDDGADVVATESDDAELAKAVADYLAAGELVKEADSWKGEAKDRITKARDWQPKEKVSTPEGTVTWVAPEAKPKFDADRFAEDHPGLFKEYQIPGRAAKPWPRVAGPK